MNATAGFWEVPSFGRSLRASYMHIKKNPAMKHSIVKLLEERTMVKVEGDKGSIDLFE
jgi:hypothetical protein